MTAGQRRVATHPVDCPDGDHFDPADPACWIARGRPAAHADALARAWHLLPDLLPDAPLEARMARTRERVAMLRPLHRAISAGTERARRDANFRFVERHLAEGSSDPRNPAILRARDDHGLDWDEAVRFADGWYAARAGWPERVPADQGSAAGQSPVAAAYRLGFREGGGCPDDLFDAARRAFAPSIPKAAIARESQRTARPLPSHWPSPTDAPRPASWPRRLLLLGRHEFTSGTLGLVAALRACAGSSDASVIVMGRGTGFLPLPDGSAAAEGDVATRLSDLVGSRDYDDILVAADGEDLAFIDAHAAQVPLARVMERTRNSAIQQRAQFRTWLARGTAPGEVRAAGHIRWSKVAAGLSGRLGEFIARYEGPAVPRGHRIVVRRVDGAPAAGYRTVGGDRLDPEIVISNRARLRDAITVALRQFAAALQLP